jgi:hypothetical protein
MKNGKRIQRLIRAWGFISAFQRFSMSAFYQRSRGQMADGGWEILKTEN